MKCSPGGSFDLRCESVTYAYVQSLYWTSGLDWWTGQLYIEFSLYNGIFGQLVISITITHMGAHEIIRISFLAAC